MFAYGADFLGVDAEGFEEVLMGFGRVELEGVVPAAHVVVGEAGCAEELDPAGFIHESGLFDGGGVAEDVDDALLLGAELLDFVVDLGEAFLEGLGDLGAFGFEDALDFVEGQAGAAVLANKGQALFAVFVVKAVAGGGAGGGVQQADFVVVEEGAAG